MTSYQTKHEIITVNSIDYSLRTLADRQQFYDHEQVAESIGISSATWSLFGVVWPASRILAELVCDLKLDGKRVLEIGCGIGLTSIVLHKMGIDITASDYHPLAKDFLEQNISRNKLSPIKFQTGNWDLENPLLGQYDLIIGSDILYEPAHAESVSRFIDRHCNDHAEVLIVDPNRGNRSRFTRKMTCLGFSHSFNRFNIDIDETTSCRGRILCFNKQ